MGALVKAIQGIPVIEEERHQGATRPTEAAIRKKAAVTLAHEIEQRMASAGVEMPGEEKPEDKSEGKGQKATDMQLSV